MLRNVLKDIPNQYLIAYIDELDRKKLLRCILEIDEVHFFLGIKCLYGNLVIFFFRNENVAFLQDRMFCVI